MGSLEQSATDFITGVFPVVVGALASEDAESLCQKNDLSFVELIRPFCQLDSEGRYCCFVFNIELVVKLSTDTQMVIIIPIHLRLL